MAGSSCYLKPKENMLLRLAKPLLLALLIGQVAGPAIGLTSDRRQPIRITADRMIVDERKGVSRYNGNVFLKQGSLEIRGDQLTVHFQQGKIIQIVATGNPARLQQKPDEREMIYSSARRMEYNTRNGQLLLIDNARVTQGANRFSGERIEYDTLKSIVAARRAEENKDGRVHVIIEPADKRQDSQE